MCSLEEVGTPTLLDPVRSGSRQALVAGDLHIIAGELHLPLEMPPIGDVSRRPTRRPRLHAPPPCAPHPTTKPSNEMQGIRLIWQRGTSCDKIAKMFENLFEPPIIGPFVEPNAGGRKRGTRAPRSPGPPGQGRITSPSSATSDLCRFPSSTSMTSAGFFSRTALPFVSSWMNCGRSSAHFFRKQHECAGRPVALHQAGHPRLHPWFRIKFCRKNTNMSDEAVFCAVLGSGAHIFYEGR